MADALATTGAMMRCSFGAAPSALNVLPVNRVTAGGMPAATIMDHVPMVNILPFDMCSSPANPAIAAGTAAALGAPTAMPCVPVTPAPWLPGKPAVVIGASPALTLDCKLTCIWGGMIEFTAPGQVTVEV